MTLIIKKSNKSLQNTINDIQLDLDEDVTITNSACTQARAKLNYTAFEEFAQMAAEIFYKDGEYDTYKGFRLFVIDSSVVMLPNTDNVKQEFNPIKVKCQIKEFSKYVSQSRVSVLFNPLNNIDIDSCIVNKNKNKNKSKKNNLIAYDERTLTIRDTIYKHKLTIDINFINYLKGKKMLGIKEELNMLAYWGLELNLMACRGRR